MRAAIQWIKVVFAIALIYGLTKTGLINFQQITLLRAHPQILILGGLCLFSGIIISGLRCAVLFRAAGFHFKVATILRLQLIGNLFSIFLPGAAGGDAVRVAYLCRLLDSHRTTGLLVLVVDRLFSLLGLVVLAGILLLFSRTEITSHPLFQAYGWIVAGLLAAAIIASLLLYIVALRFRISTLRLNWLERLRPFLRQIRAAVILFGKRWPGLVVAAILSVVASAAVAFAIVILSHAFYFALSAHITALAGTLGNISSAIPLTPGGIGIGEAMFAKVCDDLGGSGFAPYANIYLTFRIITNLVSLTGVFVYIGFNPARNRGVPSLR